MAQQNWVNLLNNGAPWQSTNGTAISAATTTATISPQAAGPQDFVLPAQPNGLQWYPNMTLRVRARGIMASGGTTTNFTWLLSVGTSPVNTTPTNLLTTGALTMGAGSVSNIPWRFDATVRCLALGSSGNTLSAHGDVLCGSTASPEAASIGTASAIYLGIAETTTAYNTYTAATAMALRATSSASFGSIQCMSFTIEQIA